MKHLKRLIILLFVGIVLQSNTLSSSTYSKSLNTKVYKQIQTNTPTTTKDQQEIKDLKDKLAKAEKDITNLKAKLSKSDQDLKASSDKLSKSEQDLKASNDKIINLSKELEQQKNTIVQQKKQIDDLNTVKTQQDKQLQQANQDKSDLLKKQSDPTLFKKAVVEYDLKRADLYFNLKDYVKARAFYELTIKKHTSLTEEKKAIVFYNLGFITLLDKKYEDSAGYFKLANMIFPSNETKLKVKSYYNLGVCYKKMKQPDKALSSFQEALSIDSSHIKSIIQIGEIKYFQKMYNDSITITKQGLEKDPKNFYLLFNLARAHDQMNDLKSANQYYSQAIASNPSHFEAQYNTGLTLTKLKKWSEAENHMKKAIYQYPNSPSLLREYGKVLNTNKKYSEAISVLKKAIQYSPNDANNYIHLANAYYMGKRFDLALLSLNKAAQLGVWDVEVFEKMGDSSFQLQRYSHSALQYSWAIALDPASIRLRRKLANTYFKHKSFRLSAIEYLWLIQKDPKKSPLLFQRLGESYLGYHDYDKAEKVFEHLIWRYSKYKDNPQIKEYLKDISKKKKELSSITK